MLVTCGMTIILITGGIDLAPGAVISLVGVVSAGLMYRTHLPVYVAVPGGLLLGIAAGAVNGVFLSRTLLPPFIVTYAVGDICRGFSYIYSNSANIRADDPTYRGLGTGTIGKLPVPVIITVIILIIVWFMLNRTKMGRNMYAIGGNPNAAKYSGINVKRIQLFMYVFSGFLSALAGIILTARTYSARSGNGYGAEMGAIAAAVLGGVSMLGGSGRLSGAILGAVIIGVLNNGLDLMGIDTYWQDVVKGTVIIAAVYFDYNKETFAAARLARKSKKQEQKKNESIGS
jgi:ribose transport system permease protein